MPESGQALTTKKNGRPWRLLGATGLVIALALLVIGLLRVKMDADILSAMPGDVPAVAGLQEFRDRFVDEAELILLLSSEDGTEVSEKDLGALAGAVEEALPDTTVRYRDPWADLPDEFGLLLAYLWMNSPPPDLQQFSDPLLNGAASEVVADARSLIATTFDQAEVPFRTTYDPLGFLWHPAIDELMAGGGASFRNQDGTARVAFARTNRALGSYREQAIWVDEIRAAAAGIDGPLRLSITGDPAFGAEIGSGMEHDMRNTVGLTSLVIGLLFLLVIRSFGQLAAAAVAMGLVLLTVLGLWGWASGQLTLVSVGFASILIGLVIDYAAVCGREAVCHRELDAAGLRKMVGPGILWAAGTTAAVFAVLGMSTLPGVAQLGLLVAVGLAAGAVVVISLFPAVAVRTRPKKIPLGHVPSPALPPRLAMIAAAVLGIGLALGTWKVGVQDVDFDFGSMRPKGSEAYAAFETIHDTFPGWGQARAEALIEAGGAEEMATRARALGDHLRAADPSFELRAPSSMWPSPEHLEANREIVAALSEKTDELIAAITGGGFNQAAVPLGEMVLRSLGEISELPYPEILDRLSRCEPFARTIAVDGHGGAGVLRGSVSLPGEPDEAIAAKLAAAGAASEGATLTGWAILGETLRPLVRADARRLPLPVLALLVIGLGIVFRDWRDVLIAVGLLAIVLLALNLAVAAGAGGGRWNFLNIFAVPLTVGIGIDYTIHLIFALRRSGGDPAPAWDGVGKALVFCGCSTAVGFGSLAMASSEALAGLGALCALGVLAMMMAAVVLLPGLWNWAHRGDRHIRR